MEHDVASGASTSPDAASARSEAGEGFHLLSPEDPAASNDLERERLSAADAPLEFPAGDTAGIGLVEDDGFAPLRRVFLAVAVGIDTLGIEERLVLLHRLRTDAAEPEVLSVPVRRLVVEAIVRDARDDPPTRAALLFLDPEDQALIPEGALGGL